MEWGARRQLMYSSVVILVILAIAIPYAFSLSPNPSCSDGRQNQHEIGVDCGGECVAVCKSEIIPLSINWARSFEVVPGVYASVAFISNKNPLLAAKKAAYSFRLFDKDGVLLSKRSGVANFPEDSVLPVFEGAISTGNIDTAKTFFEFDGPVEWERQKEKRPKTISVGSIDITEGDEPKVETSLTNLTLVDRKNVEATAVVYGEDNNAVASSRTIVDRIPANSSTSVFFAWPQPFTAKSTRVEIYLRED